MAGNACIHLEIDRSSVIPHRTTKHRTAGRSSMISDIGEIILACAESSFLEVTVFVGCILLLFGYINYVQQGDFQQAIEKSKKYQPLFGALLGIIPGCGGSIFLMPLYVKGTVTFGTVIATLIATAGDTAFVIMTQAPTDFLIVTAICFIVGIITGYIVDYYKIGDWVQRTSTVPEISNLAGVHNEAETYLNGLYSDYPDACRSRELKHLGHEEGDKVDLFLHHQEPLDPSRLRYRVTHNAYVIFWLIIAVGLVLRLLELVKIDIGTLLGIPNLGVIVGAVGTAATILYVIISQRLVKAQSHEDVEHKLFSIKETFIHNAQETALVGTWVFAAYLVYDLGVYLAGGVDVVSAAMASAGLASVILGVLIGMIPGCGPQVVFVSLYLKGMFPFAALLANTISQDGDALFPLFALHPKSALLATVLSTIPALIIGIIAYWIELGFF